MRVLRGVRTTVCPGSLARIAAAFGLIVAFIAAGGAAAAQSEGEDGFSLGIVVVNCDIQAPKNISVQEEGCRPAEGVVFNATVEGFDVSSSCTAKVANVENPITAGCTIVVPENGLTTVVSIDPSTIPAGYEAVQSEQRYVAPDGEASGPVGGLIFVNLLQNGSAPDNDVAEGLGAEATGGQDDERSATGTEEGPSGPMTPARTLPKTGTGTADTGSNMNRAGYAAVMLLSVLAFASAFAVRLKNRTS